MWLVSVSVMLAVVQCASSAGGSPRLPTRRTPPRLGVWATATPLTINTIAASATDHRTRNRGAMRHLRGRSACQQTLGRDAAAVKRLHARGARRAGGRPFGGRAPGARGGEP